MTDEAFVRLAALLGAALSMGLGAIGPAYGLGYGSCKACEAMTRQPHAASRILKMMLIGQAVSESPAIFSLIVSIFLLFIYKASALNIVAVFATLGAGICMGAGAMGPGVGAGFANASACEGVGRNPGLEGVLMRTMLIGQAVSQSTSIYALVVALMMVSQ
ncbi:MAG: ATP synthase F0 subunit C [Candidatus Auribacterota bacterium]